MPHPLSCTVWCTSPNLVKARRTLGCRITSCGIPRARDVERKWSLRAIAPNVTELQNWLRDSKAVDPPRKMQVKDIESFGEPGIGYMASTELTEGELVYEIAGDISITLVDVCEHPVVGLVVKGRSELEALTLWLMAERSSESSWRPYIDTLPEKTNTPILWSQAEREKYLAGSPVLKEAENRAQMLKQQWNTLNDVLSQNPKKFPPDVFNEEAFSAAFSVILANAVYLPSARCFALLPSLFGVKRSGREDSAGLDYDAESSSAHLTTRKCYVPGEEICIYDGRSNAELLLSTGMIEEDNPSDYLEFEFGLVQSERLYLAKRDVVQGMGFGIIEKFPVYRDRMPIQLLSYLRLSRISDLAQLAQIKFEEDKIINEMNEYEILQLLLAECRDGLTRYSTTIEEDIKDLQQVGLETKEIIGRMQAMGEKKILQGTMDNVRARLAPIRGIPTKSGLSDPNQEILDVFKTIEDLPQKPKQIFDGLMSWAKGEQDPNWGKRKKK